ncbi:uncharacterized protein L201_000373 [Kwoniella dendrophila CBS 6074]|uniref:Uncharacterized protein n=1 Tax=Kwoniella dendrophila CBS 6074 TaxID=1295534 RepID=A0AAX4JL74_9TREE
MSFYHSFVGRPSLPDSKHISLSNLDDVPIPIRSLLPHNQNTINLDPPQLVVDPTENIRHQDFPSFPSTSTSTSKGGGHRSRKSVIVKMPLIKSRSKRPTSPKNESFSFLPSFVAALDPRNHTSSTSSNSNNHNGKQQRNTSRSNPPSHQTSSSPQREFGGSSYSQFSSSTPPSTYSKGSLNRHQDNLPSIQGVFDSSYQHNDYQQQTLPNRSFSSRKSKGSGNSTNNSKRSRRDTLKLPMMNPLHISTSSASTSQGDSHPFNGHGQANIDNDNWHWEGFNQPAQVVISKESKNINNHRTSAPAPYHHQQYPRKGNNSLAINTEVTKPSNALQQDDSPSLQSQRNTPQSSLPSRSRSPSETDNQMNNDERSTLSAWLGPEDEHSLDDVELQALDVLETLSGHLLRDGFGYGTGANKQSDTHDDGDRAKGRGDGLGTGMKVPSLIRSDNSTPSKNQTRSRSTTISTQTTTSDFNKRYSQISDRDPPSIREWREQRKRTKSHQGKQGQNGRPRSAQTYSIHSQKSDGSYQNRLSSMYNNNSSRRPPPPPPPPEGSLPPLPTLPSNTDRSPIHIQTHNNNNRNPFDIEDDSSEVRQGGEGENEHRTSSRIITSPVSEAHPTQELSLNLSALSPPPIPPRSASRLESQTSRAIAEPRRVSSSTQLSSRPSTPAQRKGSKENQGIRVPLVVSPTTTTTSSFTTRDDESDMVVVVEKRPAGPSRSLSSPTIPLHQQPLPPLPSLPTLSTLSSSTKSPHKSTLAQLTHNRLPSRLLRPKRPSTAPQHLSAIAGSLSLPASPATGMTSSPFVNKLVPRGETIRRRSSTQSRSQSRLEEEEEGRKRNLTSALSFLALDEAAIQDLSASENNGNKGRMTSFGIIPNTRNSTDSNNDQFTYDNGQGKVVESSTTKELENIYIMPPSERSKIGIQQRRRTRKTSGQSSLSSIAGSEFTSYLREKNDSLLHDEEGEWTTAYEYGQSKEKTRMQERALRLSLDITNRPSRVKSVDYIAKNKPPPLNIFSFDTYQHPNEDKQIIYPKSAGLLPPPRPKRRLTPSDPYNLFSSFNQPVSPKDQRSYGAASSSQYKHRALSLQQSTAVIPTVKSTLFHDYNNDEVGEEDHGTEFDYSPIIPSPNLTTPGESYVFASQTQSDNDLFALSPDHVITEKHRKVSTTTTATTTSTNQSEGETGNSSEWSQDTYEKERKIITSLWLSSKPTRSKSRSIEQKPNGNVGNDDKDQHPIYTLGRSTKSPFTLNGGSEEPGNGNGKSIVVDGGYGKRGSFGNEI